eukprot:TRINITY_DN10052_c0_g1_i2.p1 TRINITY_DN10052_c0_g1~~TRINITY_DN10052_c0_g1_i2.p1  ORF type:complete len:236 (+),score=31.74 TRINITY_DN10052_c0_g1_i2:92-799(+)
MIDPTPPPFSSAVCPAPPSPRRPSGPMPPSAPNSARKGPAPRGPRPVPPRLSRSAVDENAEPVAPHTPRGYCADPDEGEHSVSLYRVSVGGKRELLTADLMIQPRFKEELGCWVLRLQFNAAAPRASPTSGAARTRLRAAAADDATEVEEPITDDKCWRREDATGLSWVSDQFGPSEDGMVNAKIVVKWPTSQVRDKVWNQLQAIMGKVNQHAGAGSPLRTIQAYKTSQLKGVWT